MTWSLAAIALILLAFASLSGRLPGTPLTAPMLFTLAGLLVGVEVFDLFSPAVSSEPVKLLAEMTLALVLFADASRIDLASLRDEISMPTRLLGIGLPLTIAAGFGCAMLVLGSFSLDGSASDRDRARTDRRCARAGGRHRPERFPPGSDRA